MLRVFVRPPRRDDVLRHLRGRSDCQPCCDIVTERSAREGAASMCDRDRPCSERSAAETTRTTRSALHLSYTSRARRKCREHGLPGSTRVASHPLEPGRSAASADRRVSLEVPRGVERRPDVPRTDDPHAATKCREEGAAKPATPCHRIVPRESSVLGLWRSAQDLADSIVIGIGYPLSIEAGVKTRSIAAA